MDQATKESFERRLEESSRRMQARQCVVRSDAWDVAFYSYLNSEIADQVHAFLNEKRFNLSASEVSSRVANYWESKGLIDRENPDGWRRFSILDMMWLHILSRLRAFGFNIEQLKNTRRLFDDEYFSVTKEGNRISLLEYYLSLVLRKIPVYLLVFEDGEPELAMHQDLSSAFLPLADFVRIELNPLMQKMMPHQDLSPSREPSYALSREETSILLGIRTGEYESLKITLKDGAVKKVEASETLEGSKLHEVLKQADFQDIEVKMRDGRIVHLTRTIIDRL